uniref:Vein beta-barrel domain-containing protein n=1 Tax=Megaselia scalaris TaxID=36166 RepID=T1GQK6_MEGSC
MNARILRKWGLQKFVMSSQWIAVLTILVVIFVDKCATIDNNRRIEYPNMRPFRRKPPSLSLLPSFSESSVAAAAVPSVPKFHSQNIHNDNLKSFETSLTSSANIDVRNAFLNIPPTYIHNNIKNNNFKNLNSQLHLHPLITKLTPVNDINLNYKEPDDSSYRYRRNSMRSSQASSSYQHHQQQQQQQRRINNHQHQPHRRQLHFKSRPPKRRNRRRYCSARDPEQNGSGECDIYRESLKPRGLVRENELEIGRLYYLFVEQIDLANFTILGQPIRKTKHTKEKLERGINSTY